MKHLVKRFIQLVPVLFGVSLLIFFLSRGPTDPALLLLGQEATEEQLTSLRHTLGLDLSLAEQYIRWLGNALRGDLGKSYLYGNPVVKELASRFPATLLLAVSGVLVTLGLGVPAGILAAINHRKRLDYLVLALSLIGVSMPVFLLGFLLIWILSYKLPLLPTAGWGGLEHLVLPTLAVGLPTAAVVTRLTRTSMLEVMHQDYVRTARAKGIKEYAVIVRHALRNALIPVVTIAGLQFGFLLNGSIVTEQVFAWPGIGSLMVNAVSLGDYPVIQGATILFTIMFVGVNLGVDLIYGVLDPRVDLAGKGGG